MDGRWVIVFNVHVDKYILVLGDGVGIRRQRGYASFKVLKLA